MMLWKCCTQYASKFGKLSSGHRTGKGQFSFQSQRKASQRMLTQLHYCTHLTHYRSNAQNSPSQASTVHEPWMMFKLDLEKAEEPEIKLPTSVGSLKKQESSGKISTSALLTMPRPLTVWITTNCGKFWKRWEYQTTWPASWAICMRVKKQQLEVDMEQQTGSKSQKEYVKAVYCHPAYLTYMQSTSWEMPRWMKHQLESRFLGEISITSDMQMTPRLWQKVKKNQRSSWWKWKRRVNRLA